MKNRLSFAYFNILSDNILEVVVDEGIEMTMEMIEECHQFISTNFQEDFGILVNKVNNYAYSYEAKLSVAAYENLKALAFVYYSKESRETTKELNEIRALDGWNYKVFSGLELGWQQAYEWLQKELVQIKVKS